MTITLPFNLSRMGTSAPGNHLGLEIFLDSLHTPRTADAGVLVPAKWQVTVYRSTTVDTDSTRTNTSSNSHCPLMAAPDASGEAVHTVIGNPDRILIILEGDDDEHWAKDFFLRDAHVVTDIDEASGLDKPAAALVGSQCDD